MTKPDDLAAAINLELDAFAGMLPGEIEAAQKVVSKVVVKTLKATSPTRSTKQTYARGWKTKTTRTRTGANTVIYQGAQPGLAHLLEFGHPIVSGGRTVGQAKAFPHIEAAETEAVNLYEQELTRRLENGT